MCRLILGVLIKRHLPLTHSVVLHLRICCLYALKDEVTDLKKEAHDKVKIRLNLQFKIEQMSEKIAEFKKLVKDFPEFLNQVFHPPNPTTGKQWEQGYICLRFSYFFPHPHLFVLYGTEYHQQPKSCDSTFPQILSLLLLQQNSSQSSRLLLLHWSSRPLLFLQRNLHLHIVIQPNSRLLLLQQGPGLIYHSQRPITYLFLLPQGE
ncbi:hypothetical protein YC2023_004673 [Brassica napus]